jgi:hypothetical protein
VPALKQMLSGSSLVAENGTSRNNANQRAIWSKKVGVNSVIKLQKLKKV